MVKGRSEIEAVVRLFLSDLEAHGIRVEKAYLFGSQLRGDAHEWSDIDLVVVSPDFARKLWELPKLTGPARYRTFNLTGEAVEVVAVTPEEVAGASPASFLGDILRNAELIYEKAPAGR